MVQNVVSKLGHLLFGAAEETSKTLQTKDTPVIEAVSAVSVTRAFYERQREDEAFDKFYSDVVSQARSLQIGEPKLPRYRRPSKRFGNEVYGVNCISSWYPYTWYTGDLEQ